MTSRETSFREEAISKTNMTRTEGEEGMLEAMARTDSSTTSTMTRTQEWLTGTLEEEEEASETKETDSNGERTSWLITDREEMKGSTTLTTLEEGEGTFRGSTMMVIIMI